MQLTYRGLSYNAQSPEIPSIATPISATYRGLSYSIRCPQPPIVMDSNTRLRYRGLSYIQAQ